jgi:hypothetical protein
MNKVTEGRDKVIGRDDLFLAVRRTATVKSFSFLVILFSFMLMNYALFRCSLWSSFRNGSAIFYLDTFPISL